MNPSEHMPSIAPGIIWRMLDDDAVLVSPRVGKVRVLNGVGTVVWQLLAENKSTAEIEAHLVENFEVSLSQAREDLQAFLSDLEQRGLLTWGA